MLAASCAATVFGCQASDAERWDALRTGSLVASGGLEGTFVTRIASMNDGSERISHHLTGLGQGREVELVFPPGVELPPRDAKIAVVGDDQDGVVEVEEIEIVQYPPQMLIDPEHRPPRRLAAILLFWEGGQQGLQNMDARVKMFGPDDSTNTFYQENSYGRELMAGEVFGPYAIPKPVGCDVGSIAYNGELALVDHGHDPSEYRQFMYQFPTISECGFGGLANLGAPDAPARDSWYNGSFECVVRNQEIGHNYGMGHSHSYDCVDAMGMDTPFSNDCTFEEYGDPYDPMGGGCYHMNALQKTYMGWLQECNVVRATADGLFNINAFETPCNGTQALRLPAFDGREYWLEYRTPQGLDGGGGGLSGILLHVGQQAGGTPDPYILDVGTNGVMGEGESYEDPMGEVSFTIVSLEPTHAVVDVTFPGGGSGQPTCLEGGNPVEDSGAIGSLECAEGPLPLDTTPPTVAFVSPTDGQWFEPNSDFTIEIEAADERYVTEVELYVDGEATFKKFEAPWTYDVTNIPEGDYQLGAVAKDGPNFQDVAITIHVGTPPASDSSDDGNVDDSTGNDSADEADTGDDEDDDGESTGDTGIDTDPKGCGCNSNGSGVPAFALFGIGLAIVRRRRH